MINSSYMQQSISGYNFSMTTSSGDEINLSSYHSSHTKFTKNSLELREEYGYSFSYRGDGLDEQDKKEIKEALEKIEPLLEILKPDSDFKADNKSITTKAIEINSLLPALKDENHTNFVKDSLLTKMDEILKTFGANDETLKVAKDIFDELENLMHSFSIYA